MPADALHVAPIRRVGVPRRLLRGSGVLQGTSVHTYNWAGYDSTGGDFTSVTASWVEPSILPSSAETYASFWAGLDGDGSTTVEQTGTAAYSEHGRISYYAWYEMYPDPMVPINAMTVSPGDAMTATVTSAGAGQFTLALTDVTTGDTFTTEQLNTSAQDYSAEVIAEAPSGEDGIFPLAIFGTLNFTGCAFNNKPISAFDWNQIDMVSSSGATWATTSTLGRDGASFSVTTAPTIASFSPTSGSAGSKVTLTGTGFGGATAVSFDGTSAPFSVDSATQITATVPAGATSGAIAVTTPGGTATSTTSFTVIPLSGDDTLSALGVSAGSLSPAFSPTTYSYSDSVANSVSAITVSPTTDDSQASYVLQVGGVTVTDPIALAVGATTIDVVVSAQNGDQQSYALSVTRAAPPSGDDTLSALGISAGSLSPAFSPTTYSYSDSVANSVSAITVSPTTDDSQASYVLQVGGVTVTDPIALAVGATTIDVVVSAQNGDQQSYALSVTRAAPLIAPQLTLTLSGLTNGALRLGERLTVAGAVKPASLAGTEVKLVVQREQGGEWRAVTSLTLTISAGDVYHATYKPDKTGTYRIKATIAKTTTTIAAATTWRTFKVK